VRTTETNRLNAERFARIEATLAEHSRILADHSRLLTEVVRRLEELPEAVQRQFDFRAPEKPPSE
jgi:hypothetical protein